MGNGTERRQRERTGLIWGLWGRAERRDEKKTHPPKKTTCPRRRYSLQKDNGSRASADSFSFPAPERSSRCHFVPILAPFQREEAERSVFFFLAARTPVSASQQHAGGRTRHLFDSKKNSPPVLAFAGTCRASTGRLAAFAALALSCWLSWLAFRKGSLRSEKGNWIDCDSFCRRRREPATMGMGDSSRSHNTTTHTHTPTLGLRSLPPLHDGNELFRLRAGSKFAALKVPHAPASHIDVLWAREKMKPALLRRRNNNDPPVVVAATQQRTFALLWID
jgi:hypothetical protein